MRGFYLSERPELLETFKWLPEDDQKPYFIECPYSSGIAVESADNIRQGFLEHDEVKPWLAKQTEESPSLQSPDSPAPDEGGIRILIVTRPSDGGLSLRRTDYEALEAAFHLSNTTLPVVDSSTGIYRSFKEYDPNTGDVQRFSILLDSPVCPIGAPCSYSQTYDFSTKWTTAFVAWSDFSPEEEDHQKVLTHLLKLNRHLWSRATFLPITILQIYVHFYEVEFSDNMSRLWDLERDVGITRVGRDEERAEALEDWPGSIDVKSLTAEAHAIASDLLIIAETLDWACRSIQELPNMDVYPHKQGASDDSFPPGTQTTGMLIQETVDLAEGVERSTKLLQQRCQIQANVLYSAASQTDNLISRDYSRIAQEHSALAQRSNELNLRIASSTKKDSIAMMAFTFITALFLPGTYISSLFSMNMFNWMDSAPGDNGRVVSTRFWVYWAVTVPLTTTVMLGWYVWYRTADAAWRKEAKIEMEKEADEEGEKEEDLEEGSEKASIRSRKRSPGLKSEKTASLYSKTPSNRGSRKIRSRTSLYKAPCFSHRSLSVRSKTSLRSHNTSVWEDVN